VARGRGIHPAVPLNWDRDRVVFSYDALCARL